jgi:hypothetical protein
VRPIAPNPILVLDSDHHPHPSRAAPTPTLQWDAAQAVPFGPPLHGTPPTPAEASSRSPSHATAPLALDPIRAGLARLPAVLLATTRPLEAGDDESHPWVEEAETMRLPDGATEDMLAPGGAARGTVEARIAMTRLARELGREYRCRYSIRLTVDAAGIEAMQYHLLRRLAEAQFDETSETTLDADATRHGALLSEILARKLGAAWLRVGAGHPTDWSMRLPPGYRVWPVWRIHNFLRQPWGGRGALLDFYELVQARVMATGT